MGGPDTHTAPKLTMRYGDKRPDLQGIWPACDSDDKDRGTATCTHSRTALRRLILQPDGPTPGEARRLESFPCREILVNIASHLGYGYSGKVQMPRHGGKGGFAALWEGLWARFLAFVSGG